MPIRKHFIKKCISTLVILFLIYLSLNIVDYIINKLIFNDSEEYEVVIENFKSYQDRQSNLEVTTEQIKEIPKFSVTKVAENVVTKSVMKEPKKILATTTKKVEISVHDNTVKVAEKTVTKTVLEETKKTLITTAKKVQNSIDDNTVKVTQKIVKKSVSNEPLTTKIKKVENSNRGNSAILYKDESILSKSTLNKLKTLFKCNSRDFERAIYQRGQYWVLKNYVKAEHGNLECHSHVTFVTHGDFTYMDNLIILIQKWAGPISIALYAPGSDFNHTVSSIRYVRDCSKAKELIRKWVTFHVYFHNEHVTEQMSPVVLFSNTDLFHEQYNCSMSPPYHNIDSEKTYSKTKDLLYPVNVGRNIGRDAALTHYFLSLDIELYPIPKLGARFLNMLARNTSYITGDRPRVYVLKPFEVEVNQTVPENKTQLMEMLKKKTAIPFHQNMCPDCHNAPLSDEWIKQGQTKYLEVTGIGKRTGKFKAWEPLFISTHSIPYLEERLSWNGKRDKMTQTYVLCVLDYDFLILSNAFVTHHPGIKNYVPNAKRDTIVSKQSDFIDKILSKELKAIYGERSGCIL